MKTITRVFRVLVLMLPVTAFAIPISGGVNNFAINGTSSAARPELAGAVLEDDLVAFTVGGVSGNLQTRVVRSSLDNTIDFYYRFRDLSGTGEIGALRVSDFDSSFDWDADWRIDSLGTESPDTFRYFGDGSDAFNFIFDDNPPGGVPGAALLESVFFFVDTNALFYDKSASFDIVCKGGGCATPAFSTYAPSAVPIPAAVWLLGSGLGVLGWARRRG